MYTHSPAKQKIIRLSEKTTFLRDAFVFWVVMICQRLSKMNGSKQHLAPADLQSSCDPNLKTDEQPFKVNV